MDQVDEIKQRADIVAIISQYFPLKKAGRNFKANCPFHSEKTPSFMVSPQLQIYKCFGCGASGDVISFLERYEGMEFYEALEYLAEKLGIRLQRADIKGKGEREAIYEVNISAKHFYSYVLFDHPAGKEALKYLTRNRGLKIETLRRFELGFSPKVSVPLVNYLTNKKRFNRDLLIKAGLVYPKQGGLIDRFAGRIIFPLFDHRGNPIGFGGRVMPNEEGGDAGKYINSPDTPAYHKSQVLFGLNWSKEEIKKTKQAVVVEGEFDFISSWQGGVKNTVAIKGTALTYDQINLLKRFCGEIILALDADAAGDNAARRGIAAAEAEGLEIKVAQLKDYKDPDEAVRANPEGYLRRLQNAVAIWDFLIDSIFSKFDAKSGSGKAKISREAVPVLASIGDKIVQAHYIDLVAKKLGVASSAVAEEVAIKLGVKPIENKEKETEVEPRKDRRQLLEEEFLAIAFQSDPTLLGDEQIDSLFQTRVLKMIIGKYREYLNEKRQFNLSEFSHTLPKELLDVFSHLVMIDYGWILDDEVKIKKQLAKIKQEIIILGLKEEQSRLSRLILEYERDKKSKELKDTETRLDAVNRKLASLNKGEIKV